MRLLILFVIFILFITIFSIGNVLYESDKEQNITRDIYNYTENALIWNSSNFQIEDINVSNLPENTSLLTGKRLSNVIMKGVDFLGYTLFEVSKWGIEFGYVRNEINFQNILEIIPSTVKIVIWLMICMLIAKILLPLYAICYITIYSIKSLINKYNIANKRGDT